MYAISLETFYKISQMVCKRISYSAKLQFLKNIRFSISIISMTLLFNMNVKVLGHSDIHWPK